jgi:hypothetical protein
MFYWFDKLSLFVEEEIPEWFLIICLIPYAIVGYSVLFPIACFIYLCKKIANIIDV